MSIPRMSATMTRWHQNAIVRLVQDSTATSNMIRAWWVPRDLPYWSNMESRNRHHKKNSISRSFRCFTESLAMFALAEVGSVVFVLSRPVFLPNFVIHWASTSPPCELVCSGVGRLDFVSFLEHRGGLHAIWYVSSRLLRGHSGTCVPAAREKGRMLLAASKSSRYLDDEDNCKCLHSKTSLV
jgi:hypothetical protein